MRDRAPTPAQAAWRRSRRLREVGAAALRAFNAKRLAGPRCGAKTRTTGEPCRNPALENGKCRLHGGATPKGDQWHRMQFPTKDGPHKFRKVMAKAADKQKAGRKRERRLAAMSDEQREAHRQWQRTHKPGSPGERARLRADRKAAAEFRAIADRQPSSPPPLIEESCPLQRIANRRTQIEERKARIAARRSQISEGGNP